MVKEGRLRAMGTSKYLKRRFGLGYLLRMSLASGTGGEGGDSAGHAAAATGDGKAVVSAHVAAGAIEVEEVEEQKKDEPHHTEGSSQNKNNTASSSSSSAAAATAVAERVQRRVQEFVKEATLASSAGTELSLRLPREAVPRFPELFEALETEGKELGVTSYGIETSTLEEVSIYPLIFISLASSFLLSSMPFSHFHWRRSEEGILERRKEKDNWRGGGGGGGGRGMKNLWAADRGS